MQQYRYPGTRPFTVNDRNLFFGRSDDIVNLSNLISLENIVVLYGKSGLGKTSLLNAGVIPHLFETGSYETFQIRFGSYIADNSFSPIDIFKSAIQSKEKPNNFIYNKIISKDQISQHQLWYLLKELQLAKTENPCFIIVFDQFEELFTYQVFQIEQFKKELSELLNVKIPQQVRNILKDKLLINKDYLSKEETSLLYKSLNIKIVFSIRSDRMSFLNRMTDYLPNILKKCYELQPLTDEQAISAIIEPAKKQDGVFISKTFQYDKLAIKEIINFLSKNGQQKIETFLLQILCQYTENIVVKNDIISVTINDLGDLQNISKNFYDNIITELPEKDREPARILMEEGLILEDEERRLSLYEGQIYKQFNVSKELLQKLVNTHLLRSEQFHSGGFIYEISHDTLVSPILKAKIKRLEIEKKKRIKKRVVLISLVSIFILSILVGIIFIILQAKKEAVVQKVEADKMRNFAENKSTQLNYTLNNLNKSYDSIAFIINLLNLQKDSMLKEQMKNKRFLSYLLFKNNRCWIKKDTIYYLLDDYGNLIKHYNFDNVFQSNDIFKVEKNNKFCLIDKQGNFLTEWYDFIGELSEGYRRVKKNEKFGFMDKFQKITIDFKFANAYDFSEGLASVLLNPEYNEYLYMGYIDYSGKIVIDYGKGSNYPFSNGLAKFERVILGYKSGFKRVLCGFIDKSGNVVIVPQFNEASDFKNGFSTVKGKDTTYTINVNYRDTVPFYKDYYRPHKIDTSWVR